MHHRALTLLLICLGSILTAQAQIVVEGVTDRQIAVDSLTFRVPAEAGFQYDCRLNDQSIAVDTYITCGVDYYELVIRKTELPSGESSQRTIRFIVRSSQRGGSEVGLRPWIPYPLIQSARAEFEGTTMRLVTPASLPSGLDIPVIVHVEAEAGSPARVNGMATVTGDVSGSLQVRRGYGSALLPVDPGGTSRSLTVTVGGLNQSRVINSEAAVDWMTVGGIISGNVDWPALSRVHVTNTLVIPAGTEVTIGAGSVIKLAPGVSLDITGRLVVSGTVEVPVLFAPERRSAPWGGMRFRTNTSVGQFQGAILTGSGANPRWFTENTGYDVHRKEQALLLVENEAQVSLTDCFLIDNQGQAGHGKKGFLTLTRTLIQRCITAGEYSGGSVKLLQSALLEFPRDDEVFADDDNDAIYFTTGDHYIIDSLIGWAKDDALDAGTGGLGSMTVSNCWIESTFHEGMAWSGDNGRTVKVDHTAVMNCGQGLEAGFGKPNVTASELLSLGNLTGARFGDNYDWTYAGFLRVTNSILLHNFRDVWGQTWRPGAWTNELDQMDIRGNWLTTPNPLFPDNTVWDPQSQGAALGAFLGHLATRPVGVGFAIRGPQLSERDWTNGIPIGLSRFHVEKCAVSYQFEDWNGSVIEAGQLEFVAGETIRLLPVIARAAAPGSGPYVVRLLAASGAEVTGRAWTFYAPMAPSAPFTSPLISKKSTWRYWDQGSQPTNGWREIEYGETGWKSGPGEFGFGDGGEGTVVASGPTDNHHTAYYFRQGFNLPQPLALTNLSVGFLRDDGGIVYLNGKEVFRSNMRGGLIGYEDTALGTTSSETDYFRTNALPSLLRAGTNVVAVEVHQSGTNSADMSFDLELIGQHSLPHPGLRLIHVEEEKWIVWTQAGFVLQSAGAVDGPWQNEAAARSPWRFLPSARNQFYRLALP